MLINERIRNMNLKEMLIGLDGLKAKGNILPLILKKYKKDIFLWL